MVLDKPCNCRNPPTFCYTNVSYRQVGASPHALDAELLPREPAPHRHGHHAQDQPTHIDTVRGSGRVDAIRLMKLWKERREVPFRKSFLLEVMTIEGCKGTRFHDHAGQVMAALGYIRDNIEANLALDPANTNNSLSDDLGVDARKRIKAAAAAAIAARSWGELFG